MANTKPDCAYFLLLGLCGAAFLLTIGGILTYVAFNPGSLIHGRPHAALSHIPHFHHHQQPQAHHHPPAYPYGEGGYFHHRPQHPQTTPHPHPHPPSTPFQASPSLNHSRSDPSMQPTSTTVDLTTSGQSTDRATHVPVTHPPHPQQQQHHLFNYTAMMMHEAAFEAKAKESLVLAIIGPLCLLMGIIATLIVLVLAVKYDCDPDPEPNISFLRLRSEMSLNYAGEVEAGGKSDYELLRPSSSIDQAGGHFSVNPGEA